MTSSLTAKGSWRRRILLAAPLLLFVGLAPVLGWRLLVGGDASVVPSVIVGRQAPALQLPPLVGVSRDGVAVPGLADVILRQGSVTVVNFWASWCGPCRLEHPQLLQLAGMGEINVVGVNYKDSPENARRFLGQLGNPFSAIGVDRFGAAAVDWGVYGVPETFIVDRRGIVRYRHVGPLTVESMNAGFGAALAAAQVQ